MSKGGALRARRLVFDATPSNSIGPKIAQSSTTIRKMTAAKAILSAQSIRSTRVTLEGLGGAVPVLSIWLILGPPQLRIRGSSSA